MSEAPRWITPDWAAPPNVRALFTTRAGGQSKAPYDSFNLGDHVGDEAASVRAHRDQLHREIGVRPVFLQQVHGWDGVWLEPRTPDGIQADWCAVDQRGLAAVVMVADCLPVLLADPKGRVVAAAHAGWRGLLGDATGRGVLQAAVSGVCERAGCTPAEVVAWLGPCIGPKAFEVGPEVRAAFVAANAFADERFTPTGGGKLLADLPGLARDVLCALGLGAPSGNDGSSPWCTVTQDSSFFSHRRDRVSGRMAACVWLGD